MTDAKAKRISPAFTNRAFGTLSVLTALTVIAFAASTRYLLHQQTLDAVAETADACAVALIPEANGDLTASIDRLLARHPSLQAVGTLDAAGRLQALFPSNEATTKAAALTLDSDHGPAATGVRDHATSRTLFGAVVPLVGPGEPASRRALLLFAQDDKKSVWLLSTTVFAAVAWALNLAGAWTLQRWFDTRVARPLTEFQRIGSVDRKGRDVLPTYETHGWHEMELIAKAFLNLRRGLAESYGRKLRTEQAAEQKINDHQHGMDRKLRRAQDQAVTDPLTGLRNRAFLAEELDPIYETARGEGNDLSIVMIDVDNFKRHNDIRGHFAGDEVLSFIGDLLAGAIRPTDHAARYGGDEFLLILPGASAEQAARVARRVVQLFTQYATSLAPPSDMTLSAGVASKHQGTSKSGTQLMAAADRALYEAKRAGKHNVTIDANLRPALATQPC